MKVGTKSLLFGSHQFIWHPIQVLIAWISLYSSLPSWRELICIIIHDWGYWGKPNLDGPEGDKHPEWAAIIAHRFLDRKLYYEVIPNADVPVIGRVRKTHSELCLYHSRHYAKRVSQTPSKLCWADKLCIKYDPWWFYLTRVWLSGEIKELRFNGKVFVPLERPHKEWFFWVRGIMLKVANERNGAAAPYIAECRGDEQ